jgi:succinate-acetate transporter protein
LAQIFAGLLEFRKGNTFGTTAFCSYGLFWISFVALVVMPSILGVNAPAPSAIAAYLFMWGLFTFMMFFATLKKSVALEVVFLSLTILFWLLALGEATGIGIITRLAGIEGIFCGFSAIYLAMAEVINEAYGKEILPIGSK